MTYMDKLDSNVDLHEELQTENRRSECACNCDEWKIETLYALRDLLDSTQSTDLQTLPYLIKMAYTEAQRIMVQNVCVNKNS